jgi:hypothetical protein
MVCDQFLLFPLQKHYFSNNFTWLFDYVANDIVHLQDNQLSTNYLFEKPTTMDTRLQTIPRSSRDDMISCHQLLYIPSHWLKSAFLGNYSMINRVSHSTQLVAYKDFPPHWGELEFGNAATINHVSPRTQQLSYDGAPTNQAESALFFRNESKIDRASIDGHYKEIVLLDGIPYHWARANLLETLV